MSAEKKGGHVVRLVAENVKRLRAVDIAPTGATVIVRGNNAQGKTSVLDAIHMALGGKGAQPPKVIREGETAAKVVLELEDLVVERRWTANDRSTLEVRSKDGAKFSSPQAMLDRLVGDLSFDPLAFLRLDPRKQVETLARLIGFDVVEWDAQRRGVFDQRTAVNRELHQLEARLSATKKPEGDPKPVDPAAMLEQLQGLMARSQERSAAARAADQAKAAVYAASREVELRRERIAAMKRQLAEAERELEEKLDQEEQARARAKTAEAAHAAIADPGPEMERVRVELSAAEKTNAAARAAAEYDQLWRASELKRSEAHTLTKKLDELDDRRLKAMTEAKVPVLGLAIAEGGLTLNGLPIEQASSAEQLTVSIAMGLALNPKLRVLLVRDGSLLDKASLEVLAKMAADADAQVWIEVVGDEGVGVVIEDGAVKATVAAVEEGPAQKGLGL